MAEQDALVEDNLDGQAGAQGDAGGGQPPADDQAQADQRGSEAGLGDDVDRPLSEDEREILREHRRQERHDGKQRRREAIARKDRYITQLEQQVQQQNQRLEALEGRSTNSEMARLDSAIESAAQEVEIAKSAKLEARRADANDIEMEADEALYSSRRKLEELTALKRRIVEGVRTRRAAGTPANPPDPRVVERAKSWAQSNSWYSAQGSDTDSEVVRVLDRELTRDGWDPSTKEYWDELTERARERLPERFRGGNGRQRQITGGAGGESPGGNGAAGFRLSAERIAALKEAGMWEDPKQRARMIKRYQDADREAAQQRR